MKFAYKSLKTSRIFGAAALLLSPFFASAQTDTLLNTSLREGSLPSGWTATSITWNTGAGGYAQFTATGSVLVSPVIDLSGYTSVTLYSSVAKFGSGSDGPISVSVSNDGGTTWTAQTFSTSTPNSSTYINDQNAITVTGPNVRLRFTRTASPSEKRFRDVLLVGTGSSLPVSLRSFTAGRQQQHVALSWTTASEINASRFEIERSNDGRSYNAVGTVAARNSTEGATYSYTDKNVSGSLYYRLKQVDMDGSFVYSHVAFVDGKSLMNVSLEANLVRSRLPVILSGSHEALAFSIVNLAGTTVMRSTINGSSQIDISSLASGMYLLQVVTAEGPQSFKFVKQ